jgi:beta-lactamase superfamily II metal-dependent hydrolase
MTAEIKFYPVDNGGTVLITVDSTRVLTDVNYREDEKVFDVKAALEKECGKKLDYFILSHPHDDHLQGFNKIFHCGDPSKRSEDKILVSEIVCTKYSLEKKQPSDIASPLIKEIKRRNKLSGSEKRRVGNKLTILSEGDELEVHSLLKANVLSPGDDELKSAKDADGNGNGTAINNSSLVLMWKYNNKHQFLLGADAEYEVWNRLKKDYTEDDLRWQLCEACHHCSRATFASTNENGNYVDEKDAISALSNKDGDGFVVASCKKIKKNSDNPPSVAAKNQWIKILEKDAGGNAEDRFFCTATNELDDEDIPKPVRFTITKANGLKKEKKSQKSSRTKAASVVAGAGLDRSTRYGS